MIELLGNVGKKTLKYTLFYSYISNLYKIKPIIPKVSHSAYESYMVAWNGFLHKKYPNRYTDSNPLKLIWVDPTNIKYSLEDFSKFSRHEHMGHVVEGNWDKNIRCFTELPVYQAIYDRFKNQKDWKNTDLVYRYDKKNHNNTHKKVYERGMEIERLYQQIQTNGYKSQREMYFENNSHVPYPDEITVSIGRNGKLIFHNYGRHRLSIAKILDLSRIPVWVLVRHSKWQKKRNKINANMNSQFCSNNTHPDLNDII